MLIVGFILLLAATPASAAPSYQEATVTPAPTANPSYIAAVPLPSGVTVLVERSWTFGDICVTGAILFLAVIVIGGAVLRKFGRA